jgi:hypothetical protein
LTGRLFAVLRSKKYRKDTRNKPTSTAGTAATAVASEDGDESSDGYDLKATPVHKVRAARGLDMKIRRFRDDTLILLTEELNTGKIAYPLARSASASSSSSSSAGRHPVTEEQLFRYRELIRSSCAEEWSFVDDEATGRVLLQIPVYWSNTAWNLCKLACDIHNEYATQHNKTCPSNQRPTFRYP